MRTLIAVMLLLASTVAIAQNSRKPVSRTKTINNLYFRGDSLYVHPTYTTKIFPAFVNRGPDTVSIAACGLTPAAAADTTAPNLLVNKLAPGETFDTPDGCYANYFRVKALHDSATVEITIPIRGD